MRNAPSAAIDLGDPALELLAAPRRADLRSSATNIAHAACVVEHGLDLDRPRARSRTRAPSTDGERGLELGGTALHLEA